MKPFVATALALVLLAGCQTEEPAGATLETSPGGIAYTRLYMPQATDVAIQIAWPSTWALRTDVNQAVPHIATDLILAGGAKGFAPGEVVETFADMNAAGTMWATADHLHAELVVPQENLSRAVEIAAAHLANPVMDQAWFDRVRQGFAASMTEAEAQLASQGFDALRWAILGDTPLREALTGERATIEAASREDVLRWHAETVTRTQASIVIAGSLGTADAGEVVDQLLADLPEARPVDAMAPTADFSPRRILLHVPDAATSTLTFLGPLPPTREGREFEDLLLATLLGGGDNSVLFDATRTRLRASYAFGALIDAYARNLRVLILTGEVETAQLAAAEAVVREAYAGFRDSVPIGDIAALKAPIAAQIAQNAGDPGTVAFSALMSLLDGQDPGQSLALTEMLDKVSDATLWQRAGSAWPTPDQLTVLAVSPDANALPGACVITAPADAASCP